MGRDLTASNERLAKLSAEDRKRLIERLQRERRSPVDGAIVPVRRDQPLRLSFAQQRLWFLDQLQGADDPSPYNEFGGAEIYGKLDVEVLRQSLNSVVDRHEILRTTFPAIEGSPRQQVNPAQEIELLLIDLRDSFGEELERRLGELAREQAVQPLKLSSGPLLRCLLIRKEEERHVLMVTVHHIIYDQQSANVLARELAACYQAILTASSPELPDLSVQFADYAAWERKQLEGEKLDGQIAWWKQQMTGAPELIQLPTDHARPAMSSYRGATLHFDFDADAADGVASLSQSASATNYMTMLSAFAALLQRYTGQQDLVVGTTVASRPRPELENLIGLFVTLLPIRLDLSSNPGFRELLGRVRETTLASFDHQDVPFDMLVEALKLDRQRNHPPVIQVLFVYHEDPPAAIPVSGLRFEPLDLHPGTAKFDLTLTIARTGDGFRATLDYNTDLFEAETITAMGKRFCALVESVVRNPDILLDELPLDLSVSEELSHSVPAALLECDQSFPRLPLSHHEERLWFIDRFETGNVYDSNPTYHNIPYVVHLRGRLDVAALEWSLCQLARRHTALQTRFGEDGGEPYQVVLPEVTPSLEILVEASTFDVAIETALAHAGQPFDLAADVLLRAALIPLEDDECLLALTMHHIVADRDSLKILGHQLAAIYTARQSGGVVDLLPSDGQYSDYSKWQRSLGGKIWEPLLFHWRWQLRGKVRALELPEDRPRPAVHTYTAASLNFELDGVLTQRIEAEYEASHVLLAVFKILLHRYARQEEIVVGARMPCRSLQQSNLVGPVDNLTVLRSFLGANATCRSVLAQVRETVDLAYKYRQLPFDLLVQKLNPEKDMSRTALFDVLFHYESEPSNELVMDGQTGRVIETGLGQGKYDLNLLIQRGQAGMTGTLVYNADIYDAATVERLMAHFRVLLESVPQNWDVGIDDLPLLSDDELHEQLVTWNSTQASFPDSCTIHGLFEAQVRQHSGQTALVYGDTRLSYAELNGRANRVAHVLRQRGVFPDTLVALLLDRSLEMVVSMLAVLKSGGAYLPIEPSLPQSRIEFILEDSGVSQIVSVTKHADLIPSGAASLVLLDVEADFEGLPTEDLPSVASPENLAYSIYTSGSTGKPKGALIEHRNVVRLLVNDKLPFRFTSDDAWTMFHSYSFDFSVWEMYGALLYGGKLVIVPAEVTKDPAAYLALMEREGITVLNQTPSAFYPLAHEACSGVPRELALRYVVFGGEALEPAQLNRWAEFYPNVRLVNMYGITETTVHVTYKEITASDIEQNTSSVGVPIPTTTLYIMDSDLRLLPVGVPGEICVGGHGVGRGYLNRSELTEAKFVSNPYQPEERLYRSGDLGRMLPGGELAYLGRIDDQVQIRGFRVELGEIEAVLSTHRQVHKAAVLAREEDGQQRLVAYIVSDSGDDNPIGSLSVSVLREHLRSKLPEYMVPSAFVFLDFFPITANGKLDRRALPAPEERPSLAQNYVAPRTDMERDLCAIWGKLLAVDRVGIEDNFFELGGHSLLATQTLARVADAFGVQLPVRLLFEEGTVAAMSGALQKAPRAASSELADQLKAQIEKMDPEQIAAMLSRKRAEKAALENRPGRGEQQGKSADSIDDSIAAE